MYTTYTLGVFTLKRNTNRILAFHSKVTPAGGYVNYNAWASRNATKNKDTFKIKDQDSHRAYFKIYEKTDIDAPLKLYKKRYFDSRYAFGAPNQLSQT